MEFLPSKEIGRIVKANSETKLTYQGNRNCCIKYRNGDKKKRTLQNSQGITRNPWGD